MFILSLYNQHDDCGDNIVCKELEIFQQNQQKSELFSKLQGEEPYMVYILKSHFH